MDTEAAQLGARRQCGHPQGQRRVPRGHDRRGPRPDGRRGRSHRQHRHHAARGRSVVGHRTAGAARSPSASESTPWEQSLNGMALHGGALPVGGTFLVFSDYMRPAVRLAALSSAKSVFVWSHDSVGVGEDGPTHQPVEQVSAAAGHTRTARVSPRRRQRDRGLLGRHRRRRRTGGVGADPPGRPGARRHRPGRRSRSGPTRWWTRAGRPI